MIVNGVADEVFQSVLCRYALMNLQNTFSRICIYARAYLQDTFFWVFVGIFIAFHSPLSVRMLSGRLKWLLVYLFYSSMKSATSV